MLVAKAARRRRSSGSAPVWNQVRVCTGGRCAAASQRAALVAAPVLELLGVELLDHAEAAELALDAVEVAVVVARSAVTKRLPADAVERLDPLDARAPGTAGG